MHAVHHDPVRLVRVRRCRSKCSLTCGGAAQRPRLPQPAGMTPAAGPRCAARRHARTCSRGRPARQATGAGPRLGGVERVEVERVRDRGRHRLHPQLPLGVGAALNRVVEVGGCKAAVRGRGCERGDVALQQTLHAYAAQPLHPSGPWCSIYVHVSDRMRRSCTAFQLCAAVRGSRGTHCAIILSAGRTRAAASAAVTGAASGRQEGGHQARSERRPI